MDPYSDVDFIKGKEYLEINQINKAKETFNFILINKYSEKADIDEYSAYTIEMASLFKSHSLDTSFNFLKNGFYYVLEEDPENEDEFHDITEQIVKICNQEHEYYSALSLMKEIVEEVKERDEKTSCLEWLLDRIRLVYLHINQPQRGIDYFTELLQSVLQKILNCKGLDCIGMQLIKLYAKMERQKECCTYFFKLAETIYNHVGSCDIVYDISWIVSHLYDDIMTADNGFDYIKKAYYSIKNNESFSFNDINMLMFRLFEIKEMQKNCLLILQRNHEKVPVGWMKEYSQEVIESMLGDESELNDIFSLISTKMSQIVDNES